tara:strand:+ start:1278 stop:1508 length:231 start_codon:yes stop_codon:yes gene_type:complete
MANNEVDVMGMFKAKMGFSADQVPMTEEQVTQFMLLCQQQMLGLPEEEHMEDEESMSNGSVKIIKIGKGSSMMEDM